MAAVRRFLFEGEPRTITEIHAMIPAIGRGTLLAWAREGRLPSTKEDALRRPKHVRHRPTAAQRRHFRGAIFADKELPK